MRRLLVALVCVVALAVSAPEAQSIPSSPTVYFDFTGTDRTSTEKLTSLVNAGTAPTMELMDSMTTADITADGAHIASDDADGDTTPEKWMRLAGLTDPSSETFSIFIRFKPDAVTLAGSAARSLGLVNSQGNFQIYYAFQVDDTTIKAESFSRGGGGGIPKFIGPVLPNTPGITWNLLGAMDLQLTSMDTGEACVKVEGVAMECDPTTIEIGITLQDPPWTHFVGHLPDQTHGGENTGADGYVEVYALFDSKLSESEMDAFFAYVNGQEPGSDNTRKPRSLRRHRLR